MTCEQYILDGAVVPRSLKNSTFTVHTIDNIDVAGRSISDSGECMVPPSLQVSDPLSLPQTNQNFNYLPKDTKLNFHMSLHLSSQWIHAPTKEIQAPYFNIDEEFAKEKIWTDVSQVFISYLMTEE